MGLDIRIDADISNIDSEDYINEIDKYFYLHSLSRTFFNLILSRETSDNESELHQIGRITDIDIEPIYAMTLYPDEENLEYELDNAETEDERQSILKDAEDSKKFLTGNIDTVLDVIKQLIDKLSRIDDLASLLLPTEYDVLNSKKYFSSFNIDTGNGYIDNNFGQDLRNFQRHLEFCMQYGIQTVWFAYS